MQGGDFRRCDGEFLSERSERNQRIAGGEHGEDYDSAYAASRSPMMLTPRPTLRGIAMVGSLNFVFFGLRTEPRRPVVPHAPGSALMG